MARTPRIGPGTPGCSQPLGCCPEPEDNTPDGRPIETFCTYFIVSISGRTLAEPGVYSGELTMAKLPIQEPRGMCGACENNTNPMIVNLWRANNPDLVFTQMLTVPAIRAVLRSELINNRSIMLVDSRRFWEPTIKFRDKFYTVTTTGNVPWQIMTPSNDPDVCVSGKHALEGFIHRNSIMQGKTEWGWPKYMCIDASGKVNDKCPEFGFMPWWQSPGVKSSADVAPGGYPCNCTIKPTPNNTYGCGLLYENSEVVQNDISKEFLEVFQKWIDDNKDYPEFVSNLYIGTDDEPIIVLYGFIKKNEEDEPEVTLELRRINPSTFQLERIPEALIQNQYSISRNFMYFVNYAAPKIVCNNNYLLTYDMNSCDFTETLVTKRPEISIPEIITVKYMPCTDEMLSVSNPTQYDRTVADFLMLRVQDGLCQGIIGGCCALVLNSLGIHSRICVETFEELCSPEYIQKRTIGVGFDNIRVLETVFMGQGVTCGGVSDSNPDNPVPVPCNDLAVFDQPYAPTTRPGTCCYIKYDGEWGCVVNVKEECLFLNGFFQPATLTGLLDPITGLPGFNEASCESGGIASIAIDDKTSSIVMLETRKCDLNQKYTVPFESVKSVTITNGGSGYDERTTVLFSAPTGSGPIEYPVMYPVIDPITGRIIRLAFTNTGAIMGGRSYTAPPTVTINGNGSGSGATAVVLQSDMGPANADDPNIEGSCCSIVNWSDVYYQNNDMTDISYLVSSATTSMATFGPCMDRNLSLSTKYELGVTLSLLNNGSIVKLSFESYALMNYLYNTDRILNSSSTAEALYQIAKIESDFAITTNGVKSSHLVKFNKIESNSIFFTVTK